MKKRGFTLIELLAVVVILAIIALITIPLIMNVIKDSKRGAFQNSAFGIVKAAEFIYMNDVLEGGDLKDHTFTYTNYEEDNEYNLQLNYKGQKPQTGEIKVNKDGSVTLWLWRDGFCAVKGENDEGVTVTDISLEFCGRTNIPPTIAIQGYTNGQVVIITIDSGDTLNLPNVTAYDSYNNDLTSDIWQTGMVDVNAPGTYVLTYEVTDSNNNTRSRIITVRVMDNIGPEVNFTLNGDNNWKNENGSTVLVEDLHSGVDYDSLKYVWTTSMTAPIETDFLATFMNETSIYDSSLTKNGVYYLWIIAKDTLGNTSIVRSEGFRFDTTAPVTTGITLTATNVTETGFTITRTGNGTDSLSGLVTNPYTYQLSSDGHSWVNVKTLTLDTTAAVTGLSSGESRYYRVCVRDSAGNSSCTNAQSVTTLVMVDGMIPIKWNGTMWVKASTATMQINPAQTTDWYSYTSANKKWANVALVNQTSRQGYLNAAANTPIQESDVLGYLVWIPRYRYQLFNVTSAPSSPQTINIQFENKNTTKSTGSTNGSWLTHPAFTFGGVEVSGFWVGKFETTGTSALPTIKPNNNSLRSLNISSMWNTSRLLNEKTTYGLENTHDAHMMKNTQWGAVSYLAQSSYGKNSEVWINPNSNYLTGCSGDSVSALSTNVCIQYHTTNGTQASTTGNVYGIYDMSGGAYEYVMGYNTGSSLTGSGFSTLPNAKYYDLYTSGTTFNNQAAYNRRILGDATGEVIATLGTNVGWNSDYNNFVYANGAWFIRGGGYIRTIESGLFSAGHGPGGASSANGFRIVVSEN